MPVAGTTTTLRAEYRDGAGYLVDPAAQAVSVLDSSGAVVLAPTAAVRDSLGTYHHDYAFPAAGTYTARWTGTIAGVAVTADETFVVTPAGGVTGGGVVAISNGSVTVDDVAAYLPWSPRDQGTGEQVSTFTASTAPTAVQVSAVIARISAEVVAVAGVIPVELGGFAAHVICLGAASIVAMSRSRESDLGEGPAVKELARRYELALAELVSAVSTGAVHHDPRWAFPAAMSTTTERY